MLSLLPRNTQQIALALDATTIGNKFVVLSLNILLAGSGIPIAWCVVKANQPGSWKPHWQKLINAVTDVIGNGFQVLVTADRGLYADWLYQLIVDAHWHPYAFTVTSNLTVGNGKIHVYLTHNVPNVSG